jgi:glycosyltransferase involved in cell wall biosynthesis
MISVCIPCFDRPQRTLRLLNQILEQDFNLWEAFFIGDGCNEFSKLIKEGHFSDHRITAINLPINYGGYGYKARNIFKNIANREYSIYIDNDDCIEKDHFSHYLNEIRNTDYDFVYYNTFIEPTKTIRVPKLEEGWIGHSELIIKTEFLRRIPPHNQEYGHDWTLIKNMIDIGALHKKADSQRATYKIMGVGELREKNIN